MRIVCSIPLKHCESFLHRSVKQPLLKDSCVQPCSDAAVMRHLSPSLLCNKLLWRVQNNDLEFTSQVIGTRL